MAFTVTIEDAIGRYDCVSDVQMPSPVMLDFIYDLQAFNSLTALASFNVIRTAALPNPIYSYAFVARDGRQWNQVIKMDGAQQSQPSMNFTVPGFWKVAEFSMHRPIREHVIEWAKQFEVVSISYVWK